jgi:hypothetical protein
MIDKEFKEIVQEISKELDIQCSIFNRYGIILASTIKEFKTGTLFPPKLLKLVSTRQNFANSLETDTIKSFIIETEEFFYSFSFKKELILISKLDSNINITKFIKNINPFLDSLIEKIHQLEEPAISGFDFSEEIQQMKDSLNKASSKEDKYSVIKDLVKYISEMK